jgi:hypothetical protein
LSQEKGNNNEELRGLFTIGLLAILITYRIQNIELIVNIFNKEVHLTFVVDSLIGLWSIYTFCMVYAYSGIDYLSDLFQSIGETMMQFSLLLTIIVGYALLLSVHQDRSFTLSGLLVLGIIVWCLLSLMRAYKTAIQLPKRKIVFGPAQVSKYFLVLSILSYLMIIFTPDESKNILPVFITISIVGLGIYAILKMLIIVGFYKSEHTFSH